MRRLSSAHTVFHKRVLPFVWLLVPLLSAWLLWITPTHVQQPRWAAFFPMLVIPAIGLVLFRQLIFDLVDEVDVNVTRMTNPRRITLMLRTDSRFGRDVSFIPASPRGLVAAFKPDLIAAELIERVDAIRQARR